MKKRRVQGGEATSERRRRDRASGREFSLYADGMKVPFFILSVSYTWIYAVGVGAVDDPHGRGEHCSPARCLK